MKSLIDVYYCHDIVTAGVIIHNVHCISLTMFYLWGLLQMKYLLLIINDAINQNQNVPLSVADEGYSRKASCALNSIYTFFFN